MDPKRKEIIEKVADEVRQQLEGEGSGHDWWHIVRVWNMAKHIGNSEGADMFVVELAVLLHDIADWKFHDGNDKVGGEVAKGLLVSAGVETNIINHVVQIVDSVSFKGAGVENTIQSIEGKVVHRLDAIGAIGIGRTFAYGGHKSREMYNPEVKVLMAKNFEEYKKAGQTTINHFYEKLLLLKDRMNTKTAKELAEGRHQFMEEYLERFFQEWEGGK